MDALRLSGLLLGGYWESLLCVARFFCFDRPRDTSVSLRRSDSEDDPDSDGTTSSDEELGDDESPSRRLAPFVLGGRLRCYLHSGSPRETLSRYLRYEGHARRHVVYFWVGLARSPELR